VTVAGGMVCSDEILVYADTEWTATTMKIQRAKHWALVGAGEFKCVIAGAGDEDNLRLAIQTFWAAVLQLKVKKISLADAMRALEKMPWNLSTRSMYIQTRMGLRRILE
jgi:hypothetical protein